MYNNNNGISITHRPPEHIENGISNDVKREMLHLSTTVGELIEQNEREEKVQEVLNLIEKIDKIIKSGRNILDTTHYGLFCSAYSDLNDIEKRRINSEVYTIDGDIYEEYRKIYAFDLEKFQESREKRYKSFRESVYNLDKMVEKGEDISNSFEYGLFCIVYNELNDFEKKYMNSEFYSSFGDVYTEFRIIYLTEKILSNLKSENPERNISTIKEYLDEFKNIDYFSTDMILSKLDSDKQKEIFLSCLK
ncbi:hypothetical protein DLH72_03590 [Candidatus Gracilibacteria bacterium]|nr:MAG: hypothetical protein DLH72_03590 [Candidatus Gracilibacteria bacterium]